MSRGKAKTQIDELMQYLGIESAHFFGFSMGGAVAVAFAGAHPEKVLPHLFLTW